MPPYWRGGGPSLHVMPGDIDRGAMNITAARGHGSFSRSTRVVELEHRILKSDRRFVSDDGICAQATYDIIVVSMLHNFLEIMMVVNKVTRRPCSPVGG